MSKYRKKPVEIEATQWFENGDHPQDGDETFTDEHGDEHRCEGKVVRYFRHPEVEGSRECKYCQRTMHEHGWVDTMEGGHIVCPGDFVITGVRNEIYPCKPDIFEQTYDPVDEED